MPKYPLMAAAAAALLAVPAQAEVITEEDSAFVTRDSRIVEASLREAWLALISPGKWWNPAHTFSGDAANMSLTPQAGGCFCERIPADDTATKIGLAGSVEHMRVLLSIPDQALRMRGSLGPLQSESVNGILTVTLAEADKGTKITFEYSVGGFMRFEVPVISKAVDGVMTQQLVGLAKTLGPVGDAAEDAGDDSADEAAEAADVQPAEDDAPAPENGEDTVEDETPKISVDEAFGDLKGPN